MGKNKRPAGNQCFETSKKNNQKTITISFLNFTFYTFQYTFIQVSAIFLADLCFTLCPPQLANGGLVTPIHHLCVISLFTFNTFINASCNTLETFIPACSASQFNQLGSATFLLTVFVSTFFLYSEKPTST